MRQKNEQELFWQGAFGTHYTCRSANEFLLAADIALFAKILQQTTGISSVLEFGANVGLNLRAISALLPGVGLSAIEINFLACLDLKEILKCNVFEGSILEYPVERQFDLTISKGVLIHIHPDNLKMVYSKLYEASKKYILISEYYNPVPVEVPYRGQDGKLFKRDFAGEMLDTFPDLRLVDYGFVYHRDANFKQDDTTWFLMKKST